MSRSQIALLSALLLLVGLVVILVLRNPQAPPIPGDPDHATFRGFESCVACHDPDGPLPRSRNHPIGNDCVRCHAWR